MKVLVTGAAGFLGEALVARLTREGHEVVGTDLRAGRFPTIRMDITDPAEVAAVLARERPQRVVHSAAIVDDRIPPAVHDRVNVDGTRHVLEAAATIGVERFVQISSIAALGVDPPPGSDGRSPLCADPDRPAVDGGHHGAAYFRTKALSEARVRRETRVPWVVVRPGDVYGPRSEPWVIRPLQMMRARQPVLIGGGEGRMAPAFVDNVVDGIVAALTHDAAPGGVFTFHDGDEGTTYRAYFEALASLAGAPAPRSIPRPVALAAALVATEGARLLRRPPPLTPGAVRYVTRRSSYPLHEARDVLGWAPSVPFAEAMRSMRGRLAC